MVKYIECNTGLPLRGNEETYSKRRKLEVHHPVVLRIEAFAAKAHGPFVPLKGSVGFRDL